MVLFKDLCFCVYADIWLLSSDCVFTAIVCTLNLQRKEGQGKSRYKFFMNLFFSTCYFALFVRTVYLLFIQVF